MLAMKRSSNDSWFPQVRSGLSKTSRVALLALIVVFSQAVAASSPNPFDVTRQFDVLFLPKDSYGIEQVLAGEPTGKFTPLDPPRNITRIGQEAWLRAELGNEMDAARYSVLEIPGQIFNYIDVWYVRSADVIYHFQAGDRYPYEERVIKNASYAFPVPAELAGDVEVLVRARNDTTHPMNFAARLWDESSWNQYLMVTRLWYGVFLGGMLALVGYNVLLGASLRDSSYLFYAGYILSLVAAVVLLSGLADEFFWPEGKPFPLVSAFNGIGSFFAVSFVNSFIGVRLRLPGIYWISTSASFVAMVAGLWLSFHDALPGVPSGLSAAVVQSLSLLCALYFITIAFYFYRKKLQQTRFLALGMLSLLTSMVIYFSYTHGLISYSFPAAHMLEFGALTEGMFLSLALADRIKILDRKRREAESLALAVEKNFSRSLVDARERERQSVAEALHDSIGHSVLALNTQLSQIRQNQDIDGTASRQDSTTLDESIALCKELMSDIRRMSHDLHPHILKRLGLEAALESTFERALNDSGIDWSLKIDDLSTVELDGEVSLTAYRVIQEALNNILKYSRSNHVNCEVAVNDGKLLCRISDNGVGFDVQNIQGDALGLEESAGRVRLLGGDYEVRSSPGSGTDVEFWLPA